MSSGAYLSTEKAIIGLLLNRYRQLYSSSLAGLKEHMTCGVVWEQHSVVSGKTQVILIGRSVLVSYTIPLDVIQLVPFSRSGPPQPLKDGVHGDKDPL